MFPKQVTHAKQYELKTTTAAVVMTITSCTWQMSICGDTCQPKKKKKRKRQRSRNWAKTKYLQYAGLHSYGPADALALRPPHYPRPATSLPLRSW